MFQIISHVLSFLSLSDRKEASLVNRRWYAASLHPALLRQTVITFKPTMSTLDVIRTLSKRRNPNLVLDQIDGSFRSADIVEDSAKALGEILQSLTLKGSNITESVFMALIQNCRSLTSLDISCCNGLFMSGQLLAKEEDVSNLKTVLENVTHLSLASISHLSDVMINRFLRICSSLEYLNLSGNQLVLRSEIFKRNKSESMSVLTYRNLEAYLQEKSTQTCFLIYFF